MAGPHRRDRSSLPAPTVRYEDAIEALDVDGLRIAWSSDLGFAVVDPEVAEIAHAAFEALVAAGSLALDTRTIEFADPIPVWARIARRRHVGAHPRRLLARARRRARPARAARLRLRGAGDAAEVRRGAARRGSRSRTRWPTSSTPSTCSPRRWPRSPRSRPRARCRPRSWVSGCTRACRCRSRCSRTSGARPRSRCRPGVTADGLPVGLQLMADRHRDDVCLRLARVLEQARPWPLGRLRADAALRASLAQAPDADDEEDRPADEQLQRDDPQRDVARGGALVDDHVGRPIGPVEHGDPLAVRARHPGSRASGSRHLHDRRRPRS